ncbi:hypothetical protein [Haloterrigena alkaliphila]|uniref:Uncharacterized protein n=1 Tax=Haloterrigena alkaliphila TaxID=2816475 RepID=A0A8A2VL64_9EURY|nr:hypothetical protein [Haloterrigena alkaliphila]QSW98928.1 hypothetical protein J0X25_16315 [Haloterrigena alkaliphila]
MNHRTRSTPARGRRVRSNRLRDLEDRLANTERRIERLENTLKGVVREFEDVSIGGPCKCGESLLIVRHRTIYCPSCRYRRTI